MSHSPVAVFKSFSKTAALIAASIGAIALLGWLFDLPALKSILPGLVAMKANAAASIFLAGLSVWLLQDEKTSRSRRRLAHLSAGLCGMIGLLTLAEYAFGADLGIDQLLFREAPSAVGTLIPGRMAPNTALNFLLIGLTLLLLDVKTRRGYSPAQCLIVPQGLISLLALVGYAFGAMALCGLAVYTKMALNTAAAFLLLFLGILFARPDRGFMAIITAQSLGGEMARRLFPAAALILFLLGWLRVIGQNAGLYDTDFGNGLHVTVNVCIFALVILSTATSLHKADVERKRSEKLRLQAERELVIRNKIANIFLATPDEKMYDEVLNLLLEAMESKYGVFGYLDEKGALVVPTMTRHVWDKCQVPDKNIVFPPEQWGDGAWPRAIREKRIIHSNELSTKVPKGHISITRHIALPLIFQGEPIGLLQVANKETDYEEQDIKLLESIGVVIAPILYARLQRDRSDLALQQVAEALKKANEQLEQRVLERTAQLEAANKEIGAFSYSVSHDLRAPLRSMDGFSQALLEDYGNKLDEQGRDYLQRVRAASQRMAQLIDDLLQLSRLSRTDMRLEEVNLSSLAESIAAELYQTQPERQVDFAITSSLKVRGDARLLRLALSNLLGNAWKFTAKHPQARIEFAAKQNGGPLTYFVRDDGAGFDMAYADKLFGAFQRLHSATEFEGTGIGLATVQRIVHRHGGKVWAEGIPETGATFYFTLS